MTYFLMALHKHLSQMTSDFILLNCFTLYYEKKLAMAHAGTGRPSMGSLTPILPSLAEQALCETVS